MKHLLLKIICIFFLTQPFNAFSQEIVRINKSNFRIDSLTINISKIKYLKRIEEPFIRGGDAKYARKSQIHFSLKNSRNLSVSIGDSVQIEELLLLNKMLPEYYTFSDSITEIDGKRIYTYSLTEHPTSEKYQIVISSIELNNKRYFLMISADSRDIECAFQLIKDLER